MRIDTLVNLSDGELVNSGYINDIVGFATTLKKVKREFLFISNDIHEIEKAIKKGAYGVLFSEDLEIIDKEIAWIKVENIDEAILRIFKYRLIDKSLYVCDELSLEMVKSINKDKRLAILDNMDIAEYLNGDYVFITSLEKIKKLSLNTTYLKESKNLKILNYTLLSGDFLYKDSRYKLKFPMVYSNELKKILYLFEKEELRYNLKSLKIDRFTPSFINIKNRKVKFGKSDRVIINGLKKDNYLIRELNFIFENAKYAKVKFYDKNSIKNLYQDDYNFAILIDVDIELKSEMVQENSLF